MAEAGSGRGRPIFLVGPRACGKTTIGACLARRLALPFEDTDILLQRELNANVAQIVAERGWEYFRERESSVLREAAARLAAGGVIATGGGMVLKRENRAFMRSAGRVLFLSVPADSLFARLAADPQETQRPPLTSLSAEAEAALILAEREPLYREAAHHVLDAASPPEEVCRKIFEILGY